MNVPVLIKFSLKTSVFYLNYDKLHKIICRGCVLESPSRGDSNTHPQHILFYGEILKIITFYQFDSDPRFPPFLVYVRWKSGVTFVLRCFRDDSMRFCHGFPWVFKNSAFLS